MSKKYKWVLDSFDSEILGFPSAKIQHVDKGTVPLLVNNLLQEKITHAVIRVTSNEYSLIREIGKNGFYMVDVFIEMENKLKSENINTIQTSREATLSDLAEIQVIAEESFTATRYFNDPFISAKSAKNIYKKWVENSLKKIVADSVLVLEINGIISGFITLEKIGHIPLIAVRNGFRGKGIGKKMILDSFEKFREWKVQKVSIETQLQNIPAIRSYQATGFKFIDSSITFAWHAAQN